MKKIGIVSMLVSVFMVWSMVWSGLTHADQPSDCAPEDRVVAGNTNTDCKWDFRMDEVTGCGLSSWSVRSECLLRSTGVYPYDFGTWPPVVAWF